MRLLVAHLRLISGERITTLGTGSVVARHTLVSMGDLKALLGPGCLG
ncbi:MAG: hypothetical protein KDB71_19635 [Mycobacterium sp.]|nr:hypothetical protein [Mycobacterium sp.]